MLPLGIPSTPVRACWAAPPWALGRPWPFLDRPWIPLGRPWAAPLGRPWIPLGPGALGPPGLPQGRPLTTPGLSQGRSVASLAPPLGLGALAPQGPNSLSQSKGHQTLLPKL